MRNTCLLRTLVLLAAIVGAHSASAQTSAPAVEYKVLATNKTSTMQTEMKAAGAAGYRFGGVMGGETSFGGSEVVVMMVKGAKPRRFDYRLLATSKTSTMQKELQEAGDAGYEYRGQTVFASTFGGKEVVVILERDKEQATKVRHEYRLVATKKTSTLEKEVADADQQGFGFVGLTVSQTAIGGAEVVAILRREAR